MLKRASTTRKWTVEQEAEIFQIICSRRPWQVGFKSSYRDTKISLWDRPLVQQLIVQKLRVSLSNGGVIAFLKRHGVPAIDCSGKQKQSGPSYAEGENRLQFRMSPMMSSDFDVVRPKQKTFMASVTNKQGKIFWLILKGQFTPIKQISFLKAVMAEFNNRILLVLDDTKYFAKSEVKD
jgi:hypothetical protein